MASTVYTHQFLSAKRMEGDLLADAFVSSAFRTAASKQAFYSWLPGLSVNSHLTNLPEQYRQDPLLLNITQLPAWADYKLMQAGTAFFARNAQVILNLLGLLSLPYCYAGANGAMVLYLSSRMQTEIGKRLAETAEFIWDVMAPNAFEPEGKGFAACLKVRLFHALTRYYTLKNEQWNTAEWGLPVNQEDMAGTNLSFSLIVIRGLRKLGYTVSYDEQQSFIHLWNVVGSLLGVDEGLLPADGKQAFNLEEAIWLRQARVSEQGRSLTQSLVRYFKTVNTGGYFSTSELLQVMRYLIGEETADIIGLTEPVSSLQVRLFKLAGVINLFKLPESTSSLYRKEYKKFKQLQPGI